MKKIFAFMLVLAMLLPMGLVPVANAEGEVTVKPFYVLGWSDFDETKFPYMDGLVQTNFGVSGAKAYISYSGTTVYYSEDGVDEAKALQLAEKLKKTMDARPEGLRYWHLWAPEKILRMQPENIIYLDHGVTRLKALTTAVMSKYHEIGGKLDGIVIDTEYTGLSSYYIYSAPSEYNEYTAVNDPLIYNKIVQDPRYATEVRPLLEERGFLFYSNITDYTPEIYSISNKAGSKYEQSQNIWDTVMRNRLSMYLNEWAFGPLQTYFPEASMSDYGSADRNAWFKIAGASENGQILTGGNSIKAGTASCYDFYFTRPGGSFYKALSKYTSYNDAIYEGTPFNSLLLETNFAKTQYLSNESRQIAPWIVRYNYKRFSNMDMTGSMSSTPYYAEEIYHLGMLDPEPFLAYMYKNEFKDENGNVSLAVFEDCANVVNEMMAELTRVAGYSDRKPIEMAPYWNNEFILSGMYANGRNIWRLTPNTAEISKEDFLVSGTTDPTFRANGQTITFPGGKIIEDSPISHVGTVGYWIETPKDVTPIVTRDDNYFANYPSLSLDFENEAEGTYDYNNHTPTKAWEFTWKKGATTTIEKIGDNKVLALNGTVEVRSAKLPGNITAGDSYAEDQAWQITVTIPEGLAAEAEISLLYYAGASQKVKDGGFKIVGGKVYYSTLGTDEEGKAVQEYKELMDITPGTYIFRREVNFNNKEDYRSNFAVYDTTGKELKSVTKVATPVFKAITTINFATKDTGDKPVYLDNYAITLTGITADFEIYDAHTGMPQRDESAEIPRDSATAYRLSWLNATAQEEAATVMAAFYNGSTLVEEKVIKEVKMVPGYDGVETGIVEVAEGQTVKVYLKTTVKTGEEPPVEEPKDDEPKDEKGGLGIGVIALIASSVITVIAIAVALITNKVPAPKATPAETEEKTEE